MTNETVLPSNIQKIAYLTYIVRTQAGFRKACRYARVAWDETKESLTIEGYPTSYPSVVIFEWQSYGSAVVTCVPLRKYIERQKRKLEILLSHDR
jgi:hypothetical protein